MDSYSINLGQLSASGHLVPAILKLAVSQQLQAQGRQRPRRWRYAVEMHITEAKARPAKDLDNYAKPIIDAVTQSHLLWFDDSQIEELIIRRSRDGNAADSSVQVTVRHVVGQHRGVPSYFRAHCAQASSGTPGGYSNAGYHLAIHLENEVPYDVDDDAWQEEISRLVEMIAADDSANAWIWFREHFPECMNLVPPTSKDQFLSGVWRACEEGRI